MTLGQMMVCLNITGESISIWATIQVLFCTPGLQFQGLAWHCQVASCVEFNHQQLQITESMLSMTAEEERRQGYKKKNFKQAKLDFVDQMLKWSGAKNPSSVLDVGCGIGGTTRILASNFPNADVQGLQLKLRATSTHMLCLHRLPLSLVNKQIAATFVCLHCGVAAEITHVETAWVLVTDSISQSIYNTSCLPAAAFHQKP